MAAEKIDIMKIGVCLRVDGNQLIAQPSSKLTNSLRIEIKQHKLELIKVLSQNETPTLSNNDLENIREHLDERAAIQEFDGGLSRSEAERQAKSNMRVYHFSCKARLSWISRGRWRLQPAAATPKPCLSY